MKTIINEKKHCFGDIAAGDTFEFKGEKFLKIELPLQAVKVSNGKIVHFTNNNVVISPIGKSDELIPFHAVEVGQVFHCKERVWIKTCSKENGDVFTAMQIGGMFTTDRKLLGDDLLSGEMVKLVKGITVDL